MAVATAPRKTEQIRAEFARKNEILTEYGEWLSPWDFYALLFDGLGEDEKVMVIEAERRFVAMKLDDAIDYGMGRSDIYISPAVYFQNRYKSSFLDKIFAIAVDIDGVNPRTLSNIVNNIESGKLPTPTAITNSGNGLHFYYIFTEPLTTYRNVREAVRELYNALHNFFGEDMAMTQKHWIGQPYRIVGGMTKAGDTTTAFFTGDKWTPEQLALACNSVWQVSPPVAERGEGASQKMRDFAVALSERRGLPCPDFSDYAATYTFIRENRGFSSTRAGSFPADELPPYRPKWYEDTRTRVLYDTQEGKRYSSLMALCVIAYKCGVDRRRLESDLYFIGDRWRGEKKWATAFNSDNIPAALRLYRPEYSRVRRVTLEEWLGWEFTGTCKRNGRSRAEHLERVALERKNKTVFKLERYFKQNPDASRKRAARETGMSYNTVKNYYDMARQLAGLK